jgi:hypothetical protein
VSAKCEGELAGDRECCFGELHGIRWGIMRQMFPKSVEEVELGLLPQDAAHRRPLRRGVRRTSPCSGWSTIDHSFDVADGLEVLVRIHRQRFDDREQK